MAEGRRTQAPDGDAPRRKAAGSRLAPVLAGMSVHLFTAAGSAIAFLALAAAFDRRFAAMFVWLAVAFFIDGVDGTLARALDVRRTVPFIDGKILDLIVDFLTYVLVPAVAFWRSDLLPPSVSLGVCVILTMASTLYFADLRMKTQDNWFRGFPALWNVLAVYLFVFHLPEWINAALILLAAALMFAPFVFVHPMRVRVMRRLTVSVMTAWFVFAALAVGEDLHGSWLVRIGLLACGAYFVGLPFARTSPLATDPGHPPAA